MNIFKRSIINISTGWATKIINIIVTFVSIPIILSSLGMYDYGLWVVIGQGVGFYALLDFGISNSVCRFISRSDALDELDEKIGIYSTSMLFFSIGSLIIIILTLLLTPYVPKLLNLELSHYKVAKILFIILGINIALLFPLRVGRGLLQSKHRYHIIDIVGISSRIIHFLIVLVCYANGVLSLYVLCVATALSNAITEIILFFIAIKINSEIRFSLKSINRKRMSKLFSFGSSSLVQTLSAMLYTKGQTIAVSLILGVNAVPLFSIPISLLKKIGPFIGKTGSIFMPIASNFDAKGDTEKIVKLSTYGLRYSLMIGLFIGIYIVFFGKGILQFWLQNSEMTPNDINIMYTALMIMILPLVFARSNKGNQTILRATGNHWFVSNSLMLFTLIGLVLSIFLMKYTEIGVWGAAIGWSVKGIVPEFLLFTLFIVYKYDIPKISYLIKTYLMPIIAAILIIIINAYFIPIIINGNILNFILGSIFYFLSSGFILSFCIAKKHKAKLFKMFSIVK